jgi:hypothetical protein
VGTSNQALAAAQANSTAIEAPNEMIDWMFHEQKNGYPARFVRIAESTGEQLEGEIDQPYR